MNGNDRRNGIIGILSSAGGEAVTASRLAAEFGVTRQIIVSDIALLRANGQPIAAERRGYFLKKEGGVFKTVICRHDADGLTDEFYAVVDNGGKVLNVIVEHPLYGQISAELNIASRFDADEFAKKSRELNAAFLCDLTGGVHIHTLSVPDEASYERIVAALHEKGILLSD